MPNLRRQLPPLSRIRVFEAAARHGSFARAADELNVTPAAVSQSVRALEDYLGKALFQRSAREVRLLEGGHAYLTRLGPALDEISAATEDLLSAEAMGSSIVVGAFGGVLQRWLLPLWADARPKTTPLTVRLVTMLGEVDFDAGEVDATVRTNGRPSADLCCERLLEAKMFPVASEGFIARNGMPQTVTELLAMPLLHSDSRPQDWRHWLSAAGFGGPFPEPSEDCRFDSMGTLTDAAVAGMGVAIGIECLMVRELANGELHRLLPRIPEQSCHFDLIYPTNKLTRPAFREFRDLIISRCSQDANVE